MARPNALPTHGWPRTVAPRRVRPRQRWSRAHPAMVRVLQCGRRTMRRTPACLAIVLGIGTTTAEHARADDTRVDRAAAQALFDQAKELLARDNVTGACPKLEESQRLDPTSGTLINLADCYE